MDKKFICPCGLTCCDCLFYKKDIYETAKKLRELISQSQLDTFLNLLVMHKGWNGIAQHLGQEGSMLEKHFEPFKKFSDFQKVLDAIINLECTATCRESGGCSIAGITHDCEALRCIKEKGLEGCWQCEKHETCEKLSFLRMNYGETINGNLKTMKSKGIEAIESRGNKYYAWQRKN